MKYLLDTNIFIWFIHGDSDLPLKYRKIIENSENEIFISQVSIWEIAIKVSLGKLKLNIPFNDLIPGELNGNGFLILPINNEHIRRVIELPFHHRDPFDRLIYAQSLVEGYEFCYTDKIYDEYQKGD